MKIEREDAHEHLSSVTPDGGTSPGTFIDESMDPADRRPARCERPRPTPHTRRLDFDPRGQNIEVRRDATVLLGVVFPD